MTQATGGRVPRPRMRVAGQSAGPPSQGGGKAGPPGPTKGPAAGRAAAPAPTGLDMPLGEFITLLQQVAGQMQPASPQPQVAPRGGEAELAALLASGGV